MDRLFKGHTLREYKFEDDAQLFDDDIKAWREIRRLRLQVATPPTTSDTRMPPGQTNSSLLTELSDGDIEAPFPLREKGKKAVLPATAQTRSAPSETLDGDGEPAGAKSSTPAHSNSVPSRKRKPPTASSDAPPRTDSTSRSIE